MTSVLPALGSLTGTGKRGGDGGGKPPHKSTGKSGPSGHYTEADYTIAELKAMAALACDLNRKTAIKFFKAGSIHTYNGDKFNLGTETGRFFDPRNRAHLIPSYDIEIAAKSSGKSKLNAPYALATLMAHASKDRRVRTGSACDGCKKGNGKFKDCVTASDADGDLFSGACTNCANGNRYKRCSLYNGAPLGPVQDRSSTKAVASSSKTVASSSKTVASSSVATRSAGPHTRSQASSSKGKGVQVVVSGPSASTRAAVAPGPSSRTQLAIRSATSSVASPLSGSRYAESPLPQFYPRGSRTSTPGSVAQHRDVARLATDSSRSSSRTLGDSIHAPLSAGSRRTIPETPQVSPSPAPWTPGRPRFLERSPTPAFVSQATMMAEHLVDPALVQGRYIVLDDLYDAQYTRSNRGENAHAFLTMYGRRVTGLVSTDFSILHEILEEYNQRMGI
ncbi:hypothetical protein D6C86_10586 [Aureobasidium pullulans]|uniref:Uncharacterized protein n=1 Tax=Aureobasidium pullulans TaxID=5580 RepID=A0A4S9VI23_AURPU|nr:hypothetical protein D6C94_10677 [Aureobasidium pullulans]THZ33850.1 hypothetical protein D6C87_10690 [Aureobasidium pullulans]THZ51115.1 hypothetical protein D6C86_10586 [Aureobasidium pullulans]